MIWLILYLIIAIAVMFWCAYDLLHEGEFEFLTPIVAGILWFISVPLVLKAQCFGKKSLKSIIQDWFDENVKDG